MSKPTLAALFLLLAAPASAQTIEAALSRAGSWAGSVSQSPLGRAPVRAAQADWSKWFSDGLYDVSGAEVSTESLKGKIVGLYYSAHWCPPCQLFTPALVAFRDEHAAEFEVVFVSSDLDADGQKAYMTETDMKWPAVPYQSASAKRLKIRYWVNAVPKLVILAPSGALISDEGRKDVTSSPDTALAGWKKAAGLK